MKRFIRVIEIIVLLITIVISIWMLVNGISQTIHALNPFVAKDMIIGILKIVFCELPSFFGALFLLAGEHFIEQMEWRR